MDEIAGTWSVERVSGILPPLVGLRKRIRATEGETTLGPLSARFDVVGRELRYRSPFAGFVDVLEPDGETWTGRAFLRGREYGRLRLTPV